MEWVTVLSLIIIGLVLINIELIFIPGTTVVGIIGLVMVISGISLGYDYFGTATGSMILGVTLLGSIGSLVLALRNKTWKKFSLDTSIDSKFNEGLTSSLNIGDEGITLSVLRPMGKAEFNNKTFEVKTLGNYLESGTRVRISRITDNTIIVEPLNNR